MINLKFKFEPVKFEEHGEYTRLQLPELTEEEKLIVDPIVAPTSGLRIQILDINEKDEFVLTQRKLFLFLRVFKAISIKYRQIKNYVNPKILLVTDDRPTRHILLNYASQIFANDGFLIYYQEDSSGESRVSSPFGAASVALLKEEEINLVIVITASHNDLTWNGIKFYIDYPIPMSGDLFKQISQIAINLKEIIFKPDFSPNRIHAIQKNNDYIISLLSQVLEITSLKGKKIIIWPYLGKARGIVDLFKYYGANIILVDEPINPPNPLKEIREAKLQELMESENSEIAILLDADRDRIALYVKQNGKYFFYIPNEIYSAMHNILATEYGKQIINVRTIPSDLRADKTSFANILTGVGYKHLGIILYFLLGIEVEQSKVDSAILYLEDVDKKLVKIKDPITLNDKLLSLINLKNNIQKDFLIVMWEESGGHTLNVLNLQDGRFNTSFPIIADKYPVPALILATELITRGYLISESIDWSIKGINRTISASDNQKVKIMKNFEVNDGKTITIDNIDYKIEGLSDNNNNIDIFRLKSKNSTLYFRPSGTGPEVRFYIFGNVETHLDEIKRVQDFIKSNYL